jgi:hypothetical protein
MDEEGMIFRIAAAEAAGGMVVVENKLVIN